MSGLTGALPVAKSVTRGHDGLRDPSVEAVVGYCRVSTPLCGPSRSTDLGHEFQAQNYDSLPV